MEMVNHKRKFRYGDVPYNSFQICNSSHDLAFSLPVLPHASRRSVCEVTYAFLKIREIRVLLFPIRVYPCASVVEPFWFRETLDFTKSSAIAKMGKQQLTPSE
jgi:hypothetical protein